MNIIKYIKKNGDLTFDEKPLNAVDKLIFGLLSYVKYDGVVSLNNKNKKRLKDVALDFFKRYDFGPKEKNITAVRGSINMLRIMQNKVRYRDLLMYNDIYIADDAQQFSAVCIEINPKLVYVSFEGTDQMISGWEEDFKMIYEFPVKAQRQAIEYLNKHFTFNNCKIIVGGHSKGGNLALVSAMYSNFLVRKKIIEIDSYDGPGLLKKQIESKQYRRISEKLIQVIPNNSIIGLLLRHEKNYKVVKSNSFGLFSHFAEMWRVSDNGFIKSDLDLTSKKLERDILKWLNKYNLEEREIFVKNLFNVFRNSRVNSLTQIMNNPKLILKIIKETSKLDAYTGKMTKQFFGIVARFFFGSIKEKFYL